MTLAQGRKFLIPDLTPSPPSPSSASPVASLYRRVAVGSQLFDPSYFMYKEDVDLAYRLAKTGWASIIVPSAVAYHRRTFSIQARKAVVPFFIQWLSYRNHWRNLGKASRLARLACQWLADHSLRSRQVWVSLLQLPHRVLERRPQRVAMKHDVAIITVTYNKLFDSCLESVRKILDTSSLKVTYVVVDNDSQKSTRITKSKRLFLKLK